MSGALERWVSNVLVGGTAIAAVIIAVGIVLGRAEITWAGLLALTLTPAAQVLTAAAVFFRRRERRYAAVSAAALTVLLVALAIAIVLGR